ncbi:MAG: hypothetical protein AABZ60_06590 [Planctomycetota bacterium]|mgnify:CR=1 FL=1
MLQVFRQSCSKYTLRFILLLFCVVFVRHYELAQKSFWLDETFTLLRSTPQPFPNFLREVQFDNHPPLYYFCVMKWRQLWNFQTVLQEDYWIRWLSVLFGLGAYGLLYWIAKENLTAPELFWALLLFALSPLHIFYAQEARHYSMSVFLALLQHLSFLKLITRSKSDSLRSVFVWAFLYLSSLTLGFYCFLYLLFVVPGHFILMAEKTYRKGQFWTFKEIFGCWILAFVLFLPWFYGVVLEKTQTFGHFQSSSFIYENHSFANAFSMLFSGFFFSEFPVYSRTLLIVLFGYGMALILIYLGWKNRLGFFLISLFLPFFCLLILPFKPHQFDPKHLLFATPFAFLLLSKLQSSVLGRLLLVFVVCLEILGLAEYFHPQSQKENWKAVAQQVKSVLTSESVVVVNPVQFIFSLQRYLGVPPYPLTLVGYRGSQDEIRIASLLKETSQVIWIQAENPVSVPYPIQPALLRPYQEISSFETHGYFGTIWISVFQK